MGQGQPGPARRTTPRRAPKPGPHAAAAAGPAGPAVRRLRGAAPGAAPGGLRVRAGADRGASWPSTRSRPPRSATGTATSWWTSTRTSTRCRSCCSTPGLGGRDDVCVVGDPRQTIYSFTGATPAYLTGFAAEFPDATVIRLVRNYRSTPQVVALANRVTGLAGARPLAALVGAADRGPVPLAPVPRWSPSGRPGPEPEFAEYATSRPRPRRSPRRAAALIDGGPAGQRDRRAGPDQRADRRCSSRRWPTPGCRSRSAGRSGSSTGPRCARPWRCCGRPRRSASAAADDPAGRGQADPGRPRA